MRASLDLISKGFQTMNGRRNLVQSGIQHLQSIPFEAVFWAVGLGAVASINPEAKEVVNLCLFENLGLFCPGDGLGRGVAHLARGNLAASWVAHPLAGPVVAVLLYHIATLCHEERRHVIEAESGRNEVRSSLPVSS